MGHSHSSTAHRLNNSNASAPNFPRISRHLSSSPRPSGDRDSRSQRLLGTSAPTNNTSLSSAPRSPDDTLFDRFEVVDGGFVAPINDLYHATHHYEPVIVRNLISARKLAPFYIGLDDVDEDEVQFIARSLDRAEDLEDSVPLASASATTTADTIKTTTDAIANNSSLSLQHRRSLAENRVKQWMARIGGAVECPICFLYYPSNINKSHCCDQPICTECFVQIKRIDALHPAECPYCVMPLFSIVYVPPNLPKVQQSLPQCPVSTFGITVPPPSTLTSKCLPVGGLQPDSTILSSSLPARLSLKSHSSAHSISDPTPPLTPTRNKFACSPPSLSSLTITATTHMRPSRFLVPPAETLTPLSPALSNTTAPETSTKQTGKNSVCVLDTGDQLPVYSDDLRPSYVRQLQQNHQMATLREHQDAAASRLRRMLQESLGSASDPTSPSSSPSSNQGPSRDGPAAAAALLSALGMSRRHVERLYFRALGTDVEELMVMEAIRASLADEEDRQVRANETSDPPFTPPLNHHVSSLRTVDFQSRASAQENPSLAFYSSSSRSPSSSTSHIHHDEDDTPLGLLAEKHVVPTPPATSGRSPSSNLNADLDPSSMAEGDVAASYRS